MQSALRALRCSLVLILCPFALAQVASRLSINAAGGEANGSTISPTASGDGRYVAYASIANNLVLGDLNGLRDVFVFDRVTWNTVRASVTQAHPAVEPDGDCYESRIALEGGGVVFSSWAKNIVANDVNGNLNDVYYVDLATMSPELVSVTPAGTSGNGHSYSGQVSSSGRYVAFSSGATDLVPGDTNGHDDVFLRDRLQGTTSRISLSNSGLQANAPCRVRDISANGQFILFDSLASNLAAGDLYTFQDVFLYDTMAMHLTAITVDPNFVIGNGDSRGGSVSDDGGYVALDSAATNLVSGDTNGVPDVFRYDLQAGNYVRVSLGSAGEEANGPSTGARISPAGDRVAFVSAATNLVAGDANGVDDVFVRELSTGLTSRASVATGGSEGNGSSRSPELVGTGPRVVFETDATDLVPGDFNGTVDVVLVDQTLSTDSAYCTAKVNSKGCTPFICSSGTPGLTGPDDFVLHAQLVLNIKNGMFFWGFESAAIPFGGGTMCVEPPLIRTPVLDSGGNTAISNCSGVYAHHFSQAYMASQNLAAGTLLYGQFWSRDPLLPPPDNVGLTDAIRFTLLP